jgi:hypothetical protein
MAKEDKIIISAEDVGSPRVLAVTQLSHESRVPLWWRILSVLLVLCPPLLFVVTIGGLLKVRRCDYPTRHAYALHYCGLLLVCVSLWIPILFGLVIRPPSELFNKTAESSAISIESFPDLPSANTLNGRDVAKELSPLVVVFHESDRLFAQATDGVSQPCGAGVLVFAGRDGCLLLTSRHVVDALTRSSSLGERIGVTMRDGQHTQSTVVGLHRNLDLALLWMRRENAQTDFVEPLRMFKTVEVGEQVFVIGHPEGLEFSLSGGLVAQKRGKDLIQMSAPVSPGNSGGPVYDSHGRLIAIVQSVIDKSKSPNAENLNFAVRADDLLIEDSWNLLKEGNYAIKSLVEAAKTDIDK